MAEKDKRLFIMVSDREIELIHQRMAAVGIKNRSAYIRKMAINGYIINLDFTDVREMVRLLRYCSNNLNQYARIANGYGAVYMADIRDLQQRLEEIWEVACKVLEGVSRIP